jgi:hemolysin activation/secretion protein
MKKIFLLLTFLFFLNIHSLEETISESKEEESIIENKKNISLDSQPVIKGILLVGPNTKIDSSDIEICNELQIINLQIPGSIIQLKKEVNNYLGLELNWDNINHIKQVVLKFFQDNSFPFILISLPEQKIINGVIVFVVYESKVEEVVIKNNKWFSNDNLSSFIGLKKDEKVDLNVVVQDLYWLNKNPFRNVSVLFKPGEKELTTSVEYLVEDKRPIRVYAGIDNTGFQATGLQRPYVGFNCGNVWNLDHILTFQYTVSNEFNRFHAFNASYAMPVFGKNLFTAYGGYSSTKPLSAITGFVNRGSSYQTSLRYTFALPPQSRKYVQDFTLGLDIKGNNTNTIYRLRTFIDNHTLLTQIVFKYLANYETPTVKILLEFDNYFSPSAMLPHQSNNDFSALRYKAQNKYWYSYFQCTPYFYLPHEVGLAMNFQAQLSTANLLPSEQFGLGGYNTVRGYEFREVNKDNGMIASVEAIAPALKIIRRKGRKNPLNFLGFIDFGLGWDHKKTPDVKNFEYLLSVGPGFRYAIGKSGYVRLDLGYKLHKTIYNPDASNFKWHYSVVLSY